MDFIFDNIYILVLAAAGIAQWLKATKEAKNERENPQQNDDFDLEEFEELIEQNERQRSMPAVPPPLPHGNAGPMPRVERSPVPALNRRSSVPPTIGADSSVSDELARQAALAEQLKGLKQAKQARTAKLASGDRKKSKSMVATGSLRSRLGNRRELRQAFVVKEILDKPIGLR